ncbi:MAG: hypothetical protein ACI865_001557 [Flavobacteriaceae bacterium]|jgi:uncharacterized protein (TIGR01777 family)
MKKNRIIITAANGFIGEALVQYFKEEYEVVALVRRPQKGIDGVKYVLWDGKTLGDWQQELEGAHCVINLAGRSVDCRYNEKNKKDIYDSRTESTTVIGQAIDLCKSRPVVWMNASSATLYRHSEDLPMTESNHELGTGFSVDVCKVWEKSFYDFTYSDVRQVALRTTIVLGKDGGALHPLKQLAKFGMGGKQGPGTQMFSWIHLEDFCAAVKFILLNDSLVAAVNMAAPIPLTNKKVMKSFRTAVGRSFGLPIPKFLLEFGARLIKTETELILKSRYVLPENLLEAGFEFKFPTMEEALKDLI